MRLSTGTILGPYEITGPIGAGGMGEVYRARDTRLGREVALKVLPDEVACNAERLARFEREARSASALNHPGIVTIHDFASGAGETYLVMELVRGESLRDMLTRGPVPARKLFSTAAAIADALAAAHGAGIVHRDLKPENVMVTSEGAPKILDFGLVKGGEAPADPASTRTELQLSEAGLVLGTANYMSPEQARGEPVDFRSDQFALGMMLYEMATGRHPFRRSTPIETLAAILNDDPEPVGDSLPEPFAWILERCLAKSPAERYGSTSDLARDLARLRDRSASGGMRPLPLRKPLPTKMWWAGLAVGAIGLVAAALALSAARGTRAVPVDPIQVSVATPEIANVHVGEVALPVFISPDGRHLAIYGADAHGTNHLWLHDLRTSTSRLIAERAFSAAWSPDSREIAFFAEGMMRRVSVEGGPPRDVCEARPEGTPTWHGDTILFTQYSRNPGIYRVSAGGGPAEQIVGTQSQTGERIVPWWPHFLPDGRHFLFLALRLPQPGQEITHELMVGSIDGAPPRPIMQVSSRAVYRDGFLLFVRDGILLAQPFDAEALQFTGEAKPLLDGLYYFRNTGLAAFTISHNGLLAWRSSPPPSRLAWLDRNGLELGSLGTVLAHKGGRLSPDGRRYVLGIVDARQGTSDIWVYDLERSNQERLTFQLLDENNPVWAPDGTIYYRSDGGGGPPDIFKLTPGRESRDIVHRGVGVNEPHDVSSDGRELLFIDYTPPVGADIKVLPLAPAGSQREFAATPFQELSPRFSPDGRWIAYTSDISGRPEVYVRSPGSAAAGTRISQSGGTLPRWSRNGQELFFLAPGGRLMSVGATGDFGVPRLLFQAPDAVDFDVAADGSRFLMQVVERANDPSIHLLVNWLARVQSAR